LETKSPGVFAMNDQALINRFIKLKGIRPLNYQTVEKELDIKLSGDFQIISEFTSFDYLVYIGCGVNFSEGVILSTKEARETVNLPLDTLYLAEDDASLLFMKCLGDHEEIYWIAIEDGERYCNGEPLLYDATIFKTFPEFFEYLLDREEESRAEEESNP
jgi:hypothetical protein